MERIIPFDTFNMFYRDGKEHLLEQQRNAPQFVPMGVKGN